MSGSVAGDDEVCGDVLPGEILNQSTLCVCSKPLFLTHQSLGITAAPSMSDRPLCTVHSTRQHGTPTQGNQHEGNSLQYVPGKVPKNVSSISPELNRMISPLMAPPERKKCSSRGNIQTPDHFVYSLPLQEDRTGLETRFIVVGGTLTSESKTFSSRVTPPNAIVHFVCPRLPTPIQQRENSCFPHRGEVILNLAGG